MLPRICFSTLACPQWSVDTVIEQGRGMGYHGIEWRGGNAGHIQPQATLSQRIHLRDRMRDANLFSLAITSYTAFVSDDPVVRMANVDELKRYLDLAAEVNANYVRVFLGELAPHQSIDAVYPRIIEALQACVPHAQATGVGLAIEPHDDFVQTAALTPILQAMPNTWLGAIWDIANSHGAGERADAGAANLQGRISYVQVKDGTGQGAQWQLTNVGAGEVELARAFELLQAQEYAGAYSVEWEYADHPELEPPDRALPQALAFVRELLGHREETLRRSVST